ncbi:acetyl/propionyl/methylcrotonyl-CoA carboxylase subunit alpha [Methyloligella sp. 2.7D]|uniref:acetyl-CoA carboxylase biotin carboxylase subunit n=1 Tax=unclassified Methyloligella TaxID=2625955 RepID=UPI00157C709B|nr:acetyl/propionyl/methylcrotonyl-CoA carboxylase subunit alpha [Methyloligella sp. GL2]QKP77403.1 acetyl/propionyl/methylcrotonyl-CoA carboxylase subunit alpha [Methyloligella sp. GL2]
MFSKILIANRGEIACRIIKTAKKLGIATVAVYSEADRDALHVDMADEAVLIGPAAAAQSYLVVDKIIEAAKETGAEAIHPGYGFLSENAEFAKALQKAGIAFIGPNPHAIEAMGDKIESKKLAAEADVSTVPGYLGVIEDAEEAMKIAEEIGYPVMIKASAGGGGKGMRIAYSKKEVEEGFDASRSEAKSSFGDDRVFIEKFVEEPRHIEIQVLGDKHGNVIHLAERECSVQRRNQKVLEEAPSPFLDEETRAAMGQQAVELAKAVDYDSAGTVEFIVDKDKNFYFLEMNTRLQVEHPVTELVTGIDLVEAMIKSAAGEKLGMEQSDLKLNGSAIEARVYAEDPTRNFLPSTGRLVHFKPPEVGTDENGVTVRLDTGVEEGGEISIYYDPMIAKLITHAPTRIEAIDAMGKALDAFVIDGFRHNIPFLAALMRHPRWRSGDISTKFIAEEFPEGFVPSTPDGEERDVFIAVAAAIDHLSNKRRRSITQQMLGEPVCFAVERVVELGGASEKVTVSPGSEGSLVVALTGEGKGRKMHLVSNWWFGDTVWHGTIDGREVFVQTRAILNGYALTYQGIEVLTRVYTDREAELMALMPIKEPPDTSKMLLCPMPGMVVSLAVEEGQAVQAGDTLCIVEAMKMENVLRAERDGVVTSILAEPGDSLNVDAVIMEFE